MAAIVELSSLSSSDAYLAMVLSYFVMLSDLESAYVLLEAMDSNGMPCS